MSRSTFVLFGAVAYLVFFATFLYLIGFVADLPWLSVTVDRGPASPWWLAVPIDLALVAAFGLQHSVMARPSFKRAWTRIVSPAIERSVYVLAASLMLMLLFLLWRPITPLVWSVTNGAVATAIWALFALGWLIVLLSTFLLSHFELFGLAQVWNHARGRAAADPLFRTPFFYRIVRHPLYSGFILAFFATPVMTAGHLLLAGAMLSYILIAIGHEERDLVSLFGSRYEDYRRDVGMLVPRRGRTL